MVRVKGPHVLCYIAENIIPHNNSWKKGPTFSMSTFIRNHLYCAEPVRMSFNEEYIIFSLFDVAIKLVYHCAI